MMNFNREPDINGLIWRMRRSGHRLTLDGNRLCVENSATLQPSDRARIRELADEIREELLRRQQGAECVSGERPPSQPTREECTLELVPGSTVRTLPGTWLPPVENLYNPELLKQSRALAEQQAGRELRNRRAVRAISPTFLVGTYVELQKKIEEEHAQLASYEQGELELDKGQAALLRARIRLHEGHIEALRKAREGHE